MTTYSAKDTAMVGYNVQAAVDTKNHLIVAHEVTNNGKNRAQLSSMARAARDAMGLDGLKAIADRGYYIARLARMQRFRHWCPSP